MIASAGARPYWRMIGRFKEARQQTKNSPTTHLNNTRFFRRSRKLELCQAQRRKQQKKCEAKTTCTSKHFTQSKQALKSASAEKIRDSARVTGRETRRRRRKSSIL